MLGCGCPDGNASKRFFGLTPLPTILWVSAFGFPWDINCRVLQNCSATACTESLQAFCIQVDSRRGTLSAMFSDHCVWPGTCAGSDNGKSNLREVSGQVHEFGEHVFFSPGCQVSHVASGWKILGIEITFCVPCKVQTIVHINFGKLKWHSFQSDRLFIVSRAHYKNWEGSEVPNCFQKSVWSLEKFYWTAVTKPRSLQVQVTNQSATFGNDSLRSWMGVLWSWFGDVQYARILLHANHIDFPCDSTTSWQAQMCFCCTKSYSQSSIWVRPQELKSLNWSGLVNQAWRTKKSKSYINWAHKLHDHISDSKHLFASLPSLLPVWNPQNSTVADCGNEGQLRRHFALLNLWVSSGSWGCVQIAPKLGLPAFLDIWEWNSKSTNPRNSALIASKLRLRLVVKWSSSTP